jgi:RHS repeat-associated protein
VSADQYEYDIYGRRTNRYGGPSGKDENWSFGYDDIGQLTSAAATFAAVPNDPIPGAQFTYGFDDIGNRHVTSQGSVNDMYNAEYSVNPLNQYDSRQVPGNVEISGNSPAPVVYVNNVTATRFLDGTNLLYDGFYHRRLTVQNADGPVREPVHVEEYPGNFTDYDVFVPQKTETFTYDADGNLASDGIWTYEWDAENRLTVMQMRSEMVSVLLGLNQSWLRIEFRYDAMGRRISKRVLTSLDSLETVQSKGETYEWNAGSWTKFIYDGWNLSAALVCDAGDGSISAADQTFAWGPDLSGTEQGAGGIGGLAIYVDDLMAPNTGPMFPVYDGNGNVTRLYSGVLDSNNDPIRMAEYRYGPFGEDRGRVGPQASRFPFRWSTKWADNETGLSYYGYRYYSPGMGRWLARDPLGERDHCLPMAFVHNSPVQFTDKLGLTEITGNFVGIELDAFIDWTSVAARTSSSLLGLVLLTASKFSQPVFVAGAQAVINCGDKPEWGIFLYGGVGVNFGPTWTFANRGLGMWSTGLLPGLGSLARTQPGLQVNFGVGVSAGLIFDLKHFNGSDGYAGKSSAVQAFADFGGGDSISFGVGTGQWGFPIYSGLASSYSTAWIGKPLFGFPSVGITFLPYMYGKFILQGTPPTWISDVYCGKCGHAGVLPMQTGPAPSSANEVVDFFSENPSGLGILSRAATALSRQVNPSMLNQAIEENVDRWLRR